MLYREIQDRPPVSQSVCFETKCFQVCFEVLPCGRIGLQGPRKHCDVDEDDIVLLRRRILVND